MKGAAACGDHRTGGPQQAADRWRRSAALQGTGAIEVVDQSGAAPPRWPDDPQGTNRWRALLQHAHRERRQRLAPAHPDCRDSPLRGSRRGGRGSGRDWRGLQQWAGAARVDVRPADGGRVRMRWAKPRGRGPTSQGQLHPIDWIFVKNASPTRGRIVQAQAASDHFPLFVALTSPAFAPTR